MQTQHPCFAFTATAWQGASCGMGTAGVGHCHALLFCCATHLVAVVLASMPLFADHQEGCFISLCSSMPQLLSQTLSVCVLLLLLLRCSLVLRQLLVVPVAAAEAGAAAGAGAERTVLQAYPLHLCLSTLGLGRARQLQARVAHTYRLQKQHKQTV